MAPNKGRVRTAQPENDTSAPPQMRSNEELNLSVIRRHYPEVAGIHYVAPYAVLYAYMLETSQWEKIGMEGSLFVCELVPSPIGAERFAVILLNRRGLENFFMEITSPEDIDFGEFIMMQSDQVYGLWIFSEPLSSTANVPAEIQAKLEELAARAKSSREAKERGIESGMAEAEQMSIYLQEMTTFGASKEAVPDMASEAKASLHGLTKSMWVQEVETCTPYTKVHGKRGRRKKHQLAEAGASPDLDGLD